MITDFDSSKFDSSKFQNPNFISLVTSVLRALFKKSIRENFVLTKCNTFLYTKYSIFSYKISFINFLNNADTRINDETSCITYPTPPLMCRRSPDLRPTAKHRHTAFSSDHHLLLCLITIIRRALVLVSHTRFGSSCI